MDFEWFRTNNVREVYVHHREAAVLVLTRKKNEKIVIGDNVTILVIEIRGDVVRLGIEAPKEIPVHRQEVHDAIREAERRDHENGTV